MKKTILTCGFLGAVSACGVDLELDDTANVTCSSDAECPSGLICNTTQGRCVSDEVRDFEPPSLVNASAIAPSVINASTTASVTLTFDEVVSQVQVWLVNNGRERQFDVVIDTAGDVVTASYTPRVDDVEGPFAISVMVVDMFGNSVETQLTENLTLDFTAPAVVTGSMVVNAFAAETNVTGTLPGMPGAFNTDGTVEIRFVVNEELSATPVLTLLGASNLPATTVDVVDALVTAYFELGDVLAAEGTYTGVQVELVDLAGNPSSDTSTFGVNAGGLAQVVADFTVPAPAAVDTSRAIVYTRAPWGTRASSHLPVFRLTGSAGSVEGGAWVLSYGATTDDIDDPISFITAAPDGSFADLPLAGADRTGVYVRVIDTAGNVSPMTRVRDVDWYATTTTVSAPGSPPNPHRMYAEPRATGLLEPDKAIEHTGNTALSLADQTTVSTVSAGQWLARVNSFTPDWRYLAIPFNDPITNDLYFVGGTQGLSGETNCDGGGADCLGLFRRKQEFWEQIPTVAAPGEALPEFDDDFSVFFDIAASRVTAYESNQMRLWVWTGGAWRRHPEAPAADGPRRYRGASVVYDAVRRRVLLFGGQGPSADCPSGGYCDQTWAWNEVAGWELLTTTATPPPRTNASMVYDPNRDVIVLTGGMRDVGSSSGLPCGDGSNSYDFGRCYFNDTWEFNGADWERRCDGIPAGDTCATQPYRAEFQGAVFNYDEGTVFTFGGRSIPGAGGPGCADGSGKDASNQCVYETAWEWDGTNWQQRPNNGSGSDGDPLPRWGAMLGFDTQRSKIVLFGGLRANNAAPTGFRRDAYEWVDNGWQRQRIPFLTNEPPRPRSNFAFARAGSTGAFLFAGEDLGNETCGGVSSTIQCGDAHYWGIGLNFTPGWTSADCDLGLACPYEAGGIRAAWDPAIPGGGVVIAGGYADAPCDQNGSSYCIYTWTADGLDEGWNWTRHAVTPMSRSNHAMAEPGFGGGNTICNGSGAYLFGGRVNTTYLDDLRKHTGTGGWTNVCPGQGCTTQPPGREGMAMACDDARDELIIFGGQIASGGDCNGTGTRYCDDTWRYSNGDWVKVVVADPEGDGNPPARAFHVMYWDEQRQTVVLHGGRRYNAAAITPCGDGSTSVFTQCLYGDLWEWTGSSWANVGFVETTDGGPGRRAEHGMVHMDWRGEALMHGGLTETESTVNTWYWQSGYDGRPRHVFAVDLSEAQAGPAPLGDVEVTWDAGGVSDGGGCTNETGAELLVLQAGSWTVVAQNTDDVGAPGSMNWSFAGDPTWQLPGSTLNSLLLTAGEQEIWVGAQPRNITGCASRRAQISSDYVEIRVAYRQLSEVVP